ncbi:phenoloxidase [Epithele typhae]|uniref:phenoloxidase n=1 Tax=Epithele typhae TaxID=378194 RepID=UPI0020077423|nr:phenoloxidase [Epithele typhae]KAH9946367.1 phenoloxidase [Epithele typhae]
MTRPFLWSFAILASALHASAAIGPKADLHITNGDIAPDGYTRAAVLAGGTFPGALITGQKGDRFQINVINELTNHTMLKSTSIHWHGIDQRHQNAFDGTAFVTQCPIASGDSFLYDFTVPDQAGTFWYHSHLGTQYCDGLRGGFIVYDPEDPHAWLYDVDDESTVVTLADWQHLTASLDQLFPKQNATLINGLGRSTATPNAELTTITVQRGKRYRFRIISISCDAHHVFSIDMHHLMIIEADAHNTLPHIVNSIDFFAGQRYSVVLDANQEVGNYWIRANPNKGTIGFENGYNSAILRYEGAPEEEPTTALEVGNALHEADLRPLVPQPAPGLPFAGGVDLALNFVATSLNNKFYINNATFNPPTVPVLLQLISGAKTVNELMPASSIYSLPPNATIEISLPVGMTGQIGAPHPWHLHGHSFAVVRSANSTDYNYANPLWRDVASQGSFYDSDNVTIRFRTDNPGPWFLHCHIDYHLALGFAVVMAEDIPDAIANNPVPQAWEDLCPAYNDLSEQDL